MVFFTKVLIEDNPLENKIKWVLGRVLTKTINIFDIVNYNNEYHQLLLRIFSCLLEDHGHSPQFRYKNLDVKSYNEPIFFVKEKNDYVTVFNLQLIADYFSFDSIKISIKSKFIQKKITFNNSILDVKNIPEIETGITVDRQLLEILIKLYVLADHAIEHYDYLIKNEKMDNNHESFGKNTKFLSSIITKEPSKIIQKIIIGNTNKETKKLFNYIVTNSHDEETKRNKLNYDYDEENTTTTSEDDSDSE